MLFDDNTAEDDDVMLFDEEDDESPVDSGPAEIAIARATEYLIGHEKIEQQLLNMIDGGRFPHGLIFSGPSGVGKSVMAYRLARYLFASAAKEDKGPGLFGDEPEKSTSLHVRHDDPVFTRVASGGNPDLLIIERPVDEKTGRQKGVVPVDEIRKIAPFMRLTSSIENGWRIVIVDDADTMTRQSQNSLLKILEEPPERSLLILIAHRAGALLPTVYSRCVHLPYSKLDDAPVAAALEGRAPKDTIPQIVAMAEGSLGMAYDYAAPEHAELISQSLGLLRDFPVLSWSSVQNFADTFGNKGNDDAQRIFRECMLWLAGALVRSKLPGFDGLRALPMERRLKIYDGLRAHFDRCLLGNLDKRFLIMGAYMVFET